ncbi:MAG: DUF2782 domain-containing protein [Sedimenticola sp.]
MKKLILTLGLTLVLPLATAQNAPAPVPAPPEIPSQVESGEVLEPDVYIVEDSRGTVERYSVNGRVFMEKITPSAGPSYYLLDSNGDGVMDVREAEHPTHTAIPQWVLFSW